MGARSAGLRGLQEALRSLEKRGVAARKRRGLPSSRREAARDANCTYGAGRLDARRIGEWLGDPGRAPRDPDQVWALVRVWSAWSGEGPGNQQRRYWNQLVEDAQPSPRSADRGDARSFDGLADADRRLVSEAIAEKILNDWVDNITRRHRAPDQASDGVPAPASPSEDSTQIDISRNVFVVSGRDSETTQFFSQILRRMGLNLLEWETLVASIGKGESRSVIDVLRRTPEIAQATLVLLTPDDVVQLHPELQHPNDPDFEKSLALQARPNVLLELGMVLMAYAERAIVVEVGALRPISDLVGLNTLRFDGSVRAVVKLVQMLRAAGCAVDDRDSSLHDCALLGELAIYRRRPGK